MKAELESFTSRRPIRRGSTCRFTILQRSSAALSRTRFFLARVSSLARPGTIAGDGPIEGGIKSGSIHPCGTPPRRIGAHHFVPAPDRLESGAQIAQAAIAPTGQASDHQVEVGLNVPVRDVRNDRAEAGPNGPVRDVPNGPVRDVPNDQAQVVPNDRAGDGRSDLRLVRS